MQTSATDSFAYEVLPGTLSSCVSDCFEDILEKNPNIYCPGSTALGRVSDDSIREGVSAPVPQVAMANMLQTVGFSTPLIPYAWRNSSLCIGSHTCLGDTLLRQHCFSMQSV